jgi:UDPglucose--hexose-1-phosphate uridylyltransferase
MGFIPEKILVESDSFRKRLCCKMIKKELNSNRLIFKNKDFIMFTNFASRFPYEVHIYPIKHVMSFTVLKDDSLHSLAECIHILMKAYKKFFKRLNFNFVLHNAPKNRDYHFHFEVYPRQNKQGAVETGLNIFVNSVSPEKAAKDLRGVLK